MAELDATPIVLSLVGGTSILGAYLTYLTNRRKQNSDEAAVLIAHQNTRITILEKRSDDCDDRADKLHEEHKKCMESHLESERRFNESQRTVAELKQSVLRLEAKTEGKC